MNGFSAFVKRSKPMAVIFFAGLIRGYALDTTNVSDFIERRYYPIRFVDIGLYLRLRRVLISYPFPGTLAVADILSFNIDKLFIGGMTCLL